MLIMTGKQNKHITTIGVDGAQTTLHPGAESLVKKAVIEQFMPKYAENSVLLHLRNPYPFKTGSRTRELMHIGITSDTSGSLPDIVLLDEKRGWVFFIEAVHSFGPISPQRLMMLEALCTKCQLPLVFVTAFLDRNAFRKFAPDIAWETEVWIAQEPDHMIHFNGDRFYGPRRKTTAPPC